MDQWLQGAEGGQALHWAEGGQAEGGQALHLTLLQLLGISRQKGVRPYI
ncbi:MAG: hypothetical protein ACJAWL_001550 [Motiliproteus sp.]|jgi:hypothetical protein